MSTLRFANPLDGYAFANGQGGSLWDTHNGGATWSQPAFMSGRALLGFGTGAGYAFALVGTCGQTSCSAVALDRSPVGSDSWAPLSLPAPKSVGPAAAVTVHGGDLWLWFTTATSAASKLLLAGSGAGSHFVAYDIPSICDPTLGGTIEASSARVLWAVCPTGNEAVAERSTDGGAQWDQLGVGPLPSSPQLPPLLAPASDSTAVLAPSGQAQLRRTADGGASWQTVATSGNAYWTWVGFTDATTGSGLRTTGASGAPDQLWRTSDGGASWTGPVKIS